MTEVDRQFLEQIAGSLQTTYEIVIGFAKGHGKRFAIAELMRTAQIPRIRQSETLNVLEKLERQGVVSSSGKLWNCDIPNCELKELALVLRGAVLQREIDSAVIDADRPDVVLTRPKSPSRLDRAISIEPALQIHIENTEDAFASLAASAETSLTIMTPFLDAAGSDWALSLFKVTKPGVKKELVLRFLNEPRSDLFPEGLSIIADELYRMGVYVYDFAVPRPGASKFYETFHAKVIVADGIRAYVGSANLNRHSRETSMELGLLVSGIAATRIDKILDKVRDIAIPYD